MFRLPQRYRAHLYTACIVGFTTVCAYYAYRGAMFIKKWTNAAPRLQHEEMEAFLRYKQMTAMKKDGASTQ